MPYEIEAKYFCVGVGLGAAAAILFAPKSGADAREYLQTKTQAGAGYIKTQAADAVQATTHAVERGRQTIQRQKESVVAAVEAGKAAFTATAATSG